MNDYENEVNGNGNEVESKDTILRIRHIVLESDNDKSRFADSIDKIAYDIKIYMYSILGCIAPVDYLPVLQTFNKMPKERK